VPTPDGSDRWELVDGVPMAMAPASDRPGIIHAPKPDNHNLRLPDLTVTCGPIPPPGDPAARFSNPCPRFEILSPSNWRKTMRTVASYAAIEGLAEVLVLHSARMLAQVFRSGTSGAWGDITVVTAGAEFVELTSIGFAAPLGAFYRTVT
jgi:Uma2 family endonuclease